MASLCRSKLEVCAGLNWQSFAACVGSAALRSHVSVSLGFKHSIRIAMAVGSPQNLTEKPATFNNLTVCQEIF